MTFNTKKHTETGQRRSRASEGPFICYTQPERAFWRLCVDQVHLQDQEVKWVLPLCSFLYLLSAPEFYVCMCVCVAAGASWVTVKGSEVEGWPSNRHGGRVDKLEKIFTRVTQRNKCDLRLSWNLWRRAKLEHSQIILSCICFIKRRSSCRGPGMLQIFIRCCKRKKRNPTGGPFFCVCVLVTVLIILFKLCA